MIPGIKRTDCVRGGNVRSAFIKKYGTIPDELEVCHTCDNPWCRNHRHWFLGTHSQNIRDSVFKRRHAYRDNVSHFTVFLIRSFPRSISNKEVASILRLPYSQVYSIRNNKSYIDG